jgi:2Fe-2S ferredoxin
MKIFVTDHDGEEHELEALDGWRTMEVIRDWKLNIKAECGGACACATCHVFVDDNWTDKLQAISAEEEDMLDTVPDVQPNSRLSCQILIDESLDGLKLTLAPSSKKEEEAA